MPPGRIHRCFVVTSRRQSWNTCSTACTVHLEQALACCSFDRAWTLKPGRQQACHASGAGPAGCSVHPAQTQQSGAAAHQLGMITRVYIQRLLSCVTCDEHMAAGRNTFRHAWGAPHAKTTSLRRMYLTPRATGSASCSRQASPWACSSARPGCGATVTTRWPSPPAEGASHAFGTCALPRLMWCRRTAVSRLNQAPKETDSFSAGLLTVEHGLAASQAA